MSPDELAKLLDVCLYAIRTPPATPDIVMSLMDIYPELLTSTRIFTAVCESTGGNIPILRKQVAAGIDINGDAASMPPILLAMLLGDIDIIKFLDGLGAFIRSDDYIIALRMILFRQRYDILEYTLSIFPPAAVNEQDAAGNTALHQFVANIQRVDDDTVRCVRLYVAVPGYDPAIRNHRGETVADIVPSRIPNGDLAAKIAAALAVPPSPPE